MGEQEKDVPKIKQILVKAEASLKVTLDILPYSCQRERERGGGVLSPCFYASGKKETFLTNEP